MNETSPLTRRTFLGQLGTAGAGLALAPVGVGAVSAADKLNLAFIGVGGRGAANLAGLSPGNNVVALCDLDDRRAAEAWKQFPEARRFRDFRKMFDALGKSIDAVAISTPDHTHAVAAMEAMRRGLHVYCEKPLAHSVHEIRALEKAARETGVVTQLGNQGHSSDTIRKCVEWIRDGAIGRVKEVHASSNAVHFKGKELPLLAERPAVPEGLDWDLWLGPAAERPYHPMYLPGKWRGWKAFGNGTIGDWICHVVDPAFWALDLGAPVSVEAVRVGDYDPVKHAETFPAGATLRFEFPARGDRGPVTLFWYSGLDADRKPRPEGMAEKKEVPSTGAVIVGEKGAMVHGSHGAGGLLLAPEDLRKEYRTPAPSIPRVKDHHADFVAAIREGRKAGSDFALYGGPLSELAMIGIVAMSFPGKSLAWDGAEGRFTNVEEANRHLHPPYREGWTL
jgi:predicted dehydrogenase